MVSGASTPSRYFEDMWARSADPWAHGTRWYEARKYDLTVACLPNARYRRGFEPACGAGFLTRRLALRCEELVATERSASGVETTVARCDGHDHVRVAQGQVPDDWPAGTFDLIVLSEILYYFDDRRLELLLNQARGSLDAGGHIVVVHYRRPVPEHVRLGVGHAHVHGANLGLLAAHWRAAGGCGEAADGEDHELRRRLVAIGVDVLGVDDLPVLTSGRLRGRAPAGFAGYLRALVDVVVPAPEAARA